MKLKTRWTDSKEHFWQNMAASLACPLVYGPPTDYSSLKRLEIAFEEPQGAVVDEQENDVLGVQQG